MRVVVRDERDRVLLGAGLHRDDVRHAGREAVVRPPRVGLLHADVVAEEAELIDDVLAGSLVLRRADGPAADRAREHLDMRAGVVEREAGGRTAAPP